MKKANKQVKKEHPWIEKVRKQREAKRKTNLAKAIRDILSANMIGDSAGVTVRIMKLLSRRRIKI